MKREIPFRMVRETPFTFTYGERKAIAPHLRGYKHASWLSPTANDVLDIIENILRNSEDE